MRLLLASSTTHNLTLTLPAQVWVEHSLHDTILHYWHVGANCPRRTVHCM